MRTRIRELRGAAGSIGRLLVVLAGPNGAGKSTFFDTFLAHSGLPFVNADLIARTMDPDAPLTVSYLAAAAADKERRRLLGEGTSFCTETVFSDPAGEKLAFLREAQAAGYAVILVFIGIEGPELSIARVVGRVASGGHDVPDDKLVARYPRTFANLRDALSSVDHAYLFDNSSCDTPYRFVALYRAGRLEARSDDLPPWAIGLPQIEEQKRRGSGTLKGPGSRRRQPGSKQRHSV